MKRAGQRPRPYEITGRIREKVGDEEAGATKGLTAFEIAAEESPVGIRSGDDISQEPRNDVYEDESVPTMFEQNRTFRLIDFDRSL